jgi:hypothetical protein
MKKLFLTLTLVLATGTLMNANTLEVEKEINCVEFAFDLEQFFGFEFNYEQFSYVVERCEAL